jgi:hypothetical protein
MVNNWAEDDGFILGDFSSEPSTTKKVNKRDPKTRDKRQKEEWTPADVASEFAARTYAKLRGYPGVVNTQALWGALATNRKKYLVTAVIELEAMERFLGDERNIVAIRKYPKNAHKMFLNSISAQMNDVVVSLDMDELLDKGTVSESEYVYASDGTEFDNSMAGRLEMKQHEEELKGK